MADEIKNLKAEVESLKAEVESLKVNVTQLQHRVRYLEKLLDTRASPWWKRVWWRVDGWPPWYVVGERKRRWWH